jgi:hypothetical protein
MSTAPSLIVARTSSFGPVREAVERPEVRMEVRAARAGRRRRAPAEGRDSWEVRVEGRAVGPGQWPRMPA